VEGHTTLEAYMDSLPFLGSLRNSEHSQLDFWDTSARIPERRPISTFDPPTSLLVPHPYSLDHVPA